MEGQVYHMMNVAMGGNEEARFWLRALEQKVTDKEWVEFLEGRGYRGGVDAPMCFFFE